MAEKNNYTDKDIQILEGLEPVRKRPGMYIGSTDAKGLHHLIWEIIDNAVDEALNGYGKSIDIKICKDGSVKIKDNGRGVPCGKHPSGKNTMEVIYGMLHAGGKFQEDGGYKIAGGLHGVGGAVVNALSEWMEITSCRDGKISNIRFSDGGKNVSKVVSKKWDGETGTTVHFKPDATIFQTTNFKYDVICERIKETAFLISGLKFEIEDERNGKKETFVYAEGVKAFLEYLEPEKGIFPTTIIEGEAASGIGIKVGLKFVNNYSEQLYSFVNLVRTPDGGSHEVGLKNALTRVFNDYGKNNGLLKAKEKLEGSDVREGLVCVLSVSVPEGILQFEGQTKGKLGTPQAKQAVENTVVEYLKYYLQENPDIAATAVKRMVKAAQAREAARKAREETRGRTKEKIERTLSSKLAPARSKDSKINELFLVEGDSAGGSAKQGRNSYFQAILPLRGKVLNTEKCSLNDVLKNEELNTIIHCLGAGFGPDFNVKDIKYDKIVIMTDADTDGAHIQCLLLTFFYRYMRELIENGHVYIALPPLYKLSKGNTTEYAYTDDEMQKKMKKMGKCTLQRYKGLGEMNASQLSETTMDPSSRTIIQIGIEDALQAEKRVKVLMGDKADIRKAWINENVSFSLEDGFKMEMI